MESSNNSRRTFIKNAVASGLFYSPLVSSMSTMESVFKDFELPDIYIFSKHLQFLNYRDMSEAAAEMGFDGVDLSVRPKGHVLPERVDQDLFKAVEEMKSFGLKTDLITTKVSTIEDLVQRNVIETAQKTGCKYYRTAWFRYDDNELIDTRNAAKTSLQELCKFNESIGIGGAYHNHSGNFVGSSIWELQDLLSGLDRNYMGCQYDIMHATVEGGKNWEYGLKLIRNHINTLVIKDFKWEKVNGKWTLVFTPLGKGMVDFKKYFSLLKKYQIKVPVSLHVEYDLGGAEHGLEPEIPKSEVFKRIKNDLDFIRSTWSTT